MAHQQVGVAGALLGVALLVSCQKAAVYEGAFQLPVAAAVLQPEVGGPFLEPIGFVANGHGGQIIPLALKQGRLLNDDPTASFLRTNPLPTGGLRVLTSVAVVAPTLAEVVVWAGDGATGSLLRVPYLYDCDKTPDRRECEGDLRPGVPVEQEAYWSLKATPDDQDRVGIADIAVKKGYSATELWTISYEASSDDWLVEGSRSGLDPKRARTGEPFSSEYHRLGFTLTGTPEQGDEFEVRTENGLSEHDVGGTPLAVSTSPDQSLLALIVHRRTSDRPVLRWFDPELKMVVGEVVLPLNAWPHRLAWAEDGALLVADKNVAAVWEVVPGQTTVLEHPMPWPTMDVASLDGADRRRLFVVPLHAPVSAGGPDTDASELWMFDRDTDEPIDINALAEGIQGLSFYSGVLGIEALRRPHLQPEYSDDAIRKSGRSVAVVLGNNRVVFAHEETGCLVQDNLGPRSDLSGQGGLGGPLDYDTNYLTSVDNAPTLEPNTSGRHISVNACAGIAPGEQWTLVYDQNQQAWLAEGALSGPQEAIVREDERYVSDKGEVTFLLRAGATASRDGWTIQFTVLDGAAKATGDNDLDGVSEFALGIAADPVYFEYQVGLPGPIGSHEPGGAHAGESWYPVDIRPFVLVPGASSNKVGRIDPQTARIETAWE